MANTLASALVVDVARETGITVLQNRLAALNAFSKDFSTDVLAPKKTVQVPKVTGGATGQTNPTNFESGDSALGNIPVAVNQLSASFHITNAQLQQGFRLKSLFEINLVVLANMIMDAALAPVTVANYGAPAVAAVTAANFGTDDLTVLFGAAKNYNQKNLVLDGAYLAQFIPTDKMKFALNEPGAYGFDLMAMNNRWTGAGANVQGFVADPQALAVASGLSQIDPSVERLMSVNEVVTIASLGISVRFTAWGSAATRQAWGCYDVMFGAAPGDTTALKLITNA